MCSSTQTTHQWSPTYITKGICGHIYLQIGMPNPPLVSREVVVSSSIGGPQYRSRHSVETGAEARGMEAPPQGAGADMEGVRLGTSWSVIISRDVSLFTLVLPHASSSTRTGRDGEDVAETSSVCISPDQYAPGSPGESSGSATSHCPAVAGQSMAPRYNIPSWWASSGAPLQEGPSVPRRGLEISPPTRAVETVGLASEGAQLIDPGLSTEFVETIFHSRAPSTINLYALKWRVFTSWCSDHQLDPVNCPVGTVLEFLQERFTAGLAPSTLKVYVVATSAYQIPLGEMSLGKDPLVSRFLHDTLWLCPPPFQNADQERHNLLCPVRALDAYVHRTALWH